ncbi:MAG: ABC-F family ATP-binding cassette domain-containing protein [Treponemataceae bacterium]|nr:ABC-F family ATP-binding cassette domain-containing protein [Treponemataceae bacterium]
MNLLSVKNLSKMGREAPLFTDVTFGLDDDHKAALIGRNGSGKSTLLNCIAGVLWPDNGTAVFNKEAGVSYLPQNPAYNPEETIREHIFSGGGILGAGSSAAAGTGADAVSRLNISGRSALEEAQAIVPTSSKLSIIKSYEALCDAMAAGTADADSDSFKKTYERISALMTDKDLWTYEADVRSILTELGITGDCLDRKMGTLSGGMIKKVALAQVLVEDSRLLLLDEPTNHLDIRTITWLQDYLQATKKAVLMVTHDRYFLDAVCSDMYELEHGKFNHYKGNYSTYLEKKQMELEIAQNTERRIESVLRVERDWLMRGPCARGTKARARVDNIHRMINREKLQEDKDFVFEVTGRRLGGKILELKHIGKGYLKPNGKQVIQDFSYTFKKGERIGVFGENGSGKSTFLNMITGSIGSDTGSVDTGLNTVFGYYEQNPVFKDTSLTVLEYIKEAAEYVVTNDGKTLSASQMLEQFGFEGKVQYSPVVTLSGGERKRLYLVRLLMGNPNFLVLDEPTNDFDIFTLSILESFLQGFAGCLLVVSHDRYFMDKVADTLFILNDDGSVTGYVGKCSEYIQFQKEEEALKAEEEKSARVAADAKAARTEDTSAGPRRRTFKEQKEFESLEPAIFELEDRKSELEALLSGGESDHSKLAEYGREYAELGPKLEEMYSRWEELGALRPM